MKQTLTLCLLFVLSLFTAQAASEPLDYGALELNKAYAIEAQYEYVTGYYTATETGVLTVTSTNSAMFTPFSDEACTQVMKVKYLYDTTPVYHAYYSINVTAGQTIYFRYNGINNAKNTLTFSTDDKLELTSQSVKAGSTIMCTSTSQISFNFNHTVDAQKVEIVAGETTKQVNFFTSGNKIYFEVKTPIYELMEAGALSEGQSFTVRLVGIHAEDDATKTLGEDGTIAVDYVCGAKPLKLISSTNFDNTHKFLSFWPKGDADGIITLTFDGNIQIGKNKVQLTYSDTSSGSEASNKYVETPPYRVEGNQLIIDLTGKERTPQSMLGTTALYDNMMLTVSYVCDLAGNPVYTTSSGSRGSYTRNMPYSIETVNISTELIPASGAMLGNADNIEVFATDYQKISFTGAKFTYTDINDNTVKTALVAKDQCTETPDADIDGAYTLKVPVPAEVRGQKDIFFTLTDLKAADGKDYSSLFSAKYNGFTVLDMTYQASAEAAPITLKGAELNELAADAPIVITTNRDDIVGNDSISYVTYDITDLNPVEGDDPYIVTTTHIAHTEGTSEWRGKVVVAGNTNLYMGHTYRVVVTGYQQLDKNFNPYRDLVVGTDTLYFTGSQTDYEYSDVELDSHTPNDNTISSADDFTIKLNFNGLVKVENAHVDLGDGKTTNFTSCTPVEGKDGYASQWTLSMDAATAATFTESSIVINFTATDQDGHRVKGNAGNRDTSYTSMEFTLAFNGAALTVVPTQGGEAGEELDEIYEFDVTAEDAITLGALNLGEAHVFNMLNTIDVPVVKARLIFEDETTQAINDLIDAGEYDAAVKQYGQEATDAAYFATTNTIRLTLEQPITEEGGYTLVIPAEYFNVGEQSMGQLSKAYEGFFIVKGNDEPIVANFTTSPKNGSTVQSLQEVVITFTDYNEVGMGSGTISLKKNGEEIETVDALGFDDDWSKFSINFTDKQTAEGTYTIEIPEGYFVSPEGDNLPAITLTYYIGTDTGINNVTVDTKQADAIYTLSGVRVSGKLPAGVYIKNGKKVIIK